MSQEVSGIDPHSLQLEITESGLMDHVGIAIPNVKRLSELGVGVQVDDFGTGYSSLSYLTQLAVSALKVDRAFTTSMLDSRPHMQIVEAIVSLARIMNLAVTAADHPAQPLLAHDSLHGVAGIEMSLPVYRVHSLELLVAGLSRLTGRPVLDVAHLWLPALAALLIPLAYARLFRLLIPERWLWAVGIAVAYLLYANGGSHGWPT